MSAETRRLLEAAKFALLALKRENARSPIGAHQEEIAELEQAIARLEGITG